MWDEALIFQIVNLLLYPALSALDVLFGVVVIYKWCIRKGSIKHPVFGTLMSKMSFFAAVVAVSRSTALVFSLVFYGRSNLSRYVVLSPDFGTGIKEVSSHAAAMALLVPVGPLTAGAVQMSRKSTVVAVLIETLTCYVAHIGTEEAGGAFNGFRAVLG